MKTTPRNRNGSYTCEKILKITYNELTVVNATIRDYFSSVRSVMIKKFANTLHLQACCILLAGVKLVPLPYGQFANIY